MTTSSSQALSRPPRRKRRREPPRYYRCRGPEVCPGSQVAARYIESRVLAWLRQPSHGHSLTAATVLAAYAPVWALLFPRFQRQLAGQLIRKIRWHGRSKRFTILLDDAGIARALAELWSLEHGRAIPTVWPKRDGRRRRRR